MDSFFQQVYDLAAQIPAGKVVSYGQLARMLGNPRSARAVGWAMRACPEGLPWQRVIRADGSLTGGEVQRALLRAEGAAFLPDGRVDFRSCGWL